MIETPDEPPEDDADKPEAADKPAESELDPTIKAIFDKVWNDAYNRGRSAGWRQFRRAVYDALRPLMTSDDPPPEENKLTDAVAAEPAVPKKGTLPMYPRGAIPELVMDMVRERPGLTGVEIVTFARDRNTPLHERSVRTALRRLRMARRISNISGRWYLFGHEPVPEPHSDQDDREPGLDFPNNEGG